MVCRDGDVNSEGAFVSPHEGFRADLCPTSRKSGFSRFDFVDLGGRAGRAGCPLTRRSQVQSLCAPLLESF